MLVLLIFCLLIALEQTMSTEEDCARDDIEQLNKKMAELNNKYYLAEWNYSTNLTEENLSNFLVTSENISKESRVDHSHLLKYKWEKFQDISLRRQFKMFLKIGILALSGEKLSKLNQIVSHMQEQFAKAKICSFVNKNICHLQLEPDITEIMATSRNPAELKHVWVEWRKSVGRNLKEKYINYVKLMNEAAHKNKFKDASAMSLDVYETENIKQQVNNLWQQVKPVYLQFHAFVRWKLRKFYGDIVSEKGPIPAHLLGNMWAQSWEFISNITLPFPKRNYVDITNALKNYGYTTRKIFKTAEDFFLSINLSAMPQTFWKNSVLEKPEDREMVCHASAWDMSDGKDYRIRQCTRIEQESFTTAHHEMGHIEYFLQYKNISPIFQAGANPAFHEAVGDTISLSVTTLKHFNKIGLKIGNFEHYQDQMNHLFLNALSKIPFLPFGYLVDLWRWDVFSGNTKPKNYNSRWWELRKHYQGIEPPIPRSENDFDPASKFHIIANYEYIAYFMSHILQFQFHKALCIKAGEYQPNNLKKLLHQCDIYDSKAAGNLFKEMLKLGCSKPWPEALSVLTGSRDMDAGPFLEYFDPLIKWIVDENKKNNIYLGWEESETVNK